MLAALARAEGEGQAEGEGEGGGGDPGRRSGFALAYDDGRLGRELRAAGAAVEGLGPARFGRPWTVVRARRRLARLLAGAGPAAVICHACWSHALAAPVARRAGRPLVFWMHDRAGGGHWLERLAARTPPDLVVANSRFTAATAPGLFPGVPVEVLPCAVAPPRVADPAAARARLRRELGTPADAVVIVLAGRLEPWKGHRLLLAALGRLRDRPGWAAWIAGGPQKPGEAAYLDALRAGAAAAGLADRVRFLGQRADVPELLAAADLHCQPNTGPEPFGVAFVEALYAGLPVVTTRLGGATEILTADCGVLVEPADPEALAATLAGLIADPSARARLGAAGPARARALGDPAAVGARLRELLPGPARAAPAPAPAPAPPAWASRAAALVRLLPAGRYRAMNRLCRRVPPPFVAPLAVPGARPGLRFECDLRNALAREVFFTGRYEPQETALVPRLLGPGGTFVDVGAHWGYFSLLAAGRLGPKGRIVAVEADPRMHRTLRRNLALNGLAGAEAVLAAVAEAPGVLRLAGFDDRQDNWGTSRLIPPGAGAGAGAEAATTFAVAAAPLDDLLDGRGVGAVDLVKIDIEGAEALALRGMRAGLHGRRYRRILLELHPAELAAHGTGVGPVVAALHAAGYRGWTVDHSPRAGRRAAYARRARAEDFLRPLEPAGPLDAWPHQLWIAPDVPLFPADPGRR
jgi:FkbM family methyltransferase